MNEMLIKRVQIYLLRSLHLYLKINDVELPVNECMIRMEGVE